MIHILRKIKLWVGVAFCFICSMLYAVEPEKYSDYRLIVHRQHALFEENAAFLTTFDINRNSFVEMSVEKRNGRFSDYNQSDDDIACKLKTASFYRLNQRTMFYGEIGYSVFTKRRIGGSAFINPQNTPFDIVEIDENNRGKKRQETYHLQGAVGHRLSSRLAVGAGMDYTAANYAKYKDLRHRNIRMDMQVSAGMNYRMFSGAIFGLSYYYHRSNEAVLFNIYGNTDRQYTSLISFGNFYGSSETFGESGFTSEGVRSKPLFSQWHGAALQLQFNRSGRSFFNELYLRRLDGRFGTGASTSVVYTRHEGGEMGYRGKMTTGDSRNVLHVVDFLLSSKRLKNFENSYRESTDDSNVSRVIYYGSNEVFSRKELYGTVSHTTYWKEKEGAPSWVAGWEGEVFLRSNKTVIYPYFRHQNLFFFGIKGSVEHNRMYRSALYGIRFASGYGRGGGTLKKDGLYATPGNDKNAPTSRDDLLMKEYEYRTVPRTFSELSLKYQRKLRKEINGYVLFGLRYTRAFGGEVIGKDAFRFTLNAGCTF